jgi:diguanylate cyclase (GGDEF)-like protein
LTPRIMDTETTETLIERAWASRNGDYAAGLALAEQAGQVAVRLADRQNECRALAVQGYFLLGLDRGTEAHLCLEQGLELSRDIGNQRIEAECLYHLGGERTAADDYTAALDYLSQAETLYGVLGDQAGQSGALNGIGGIYSILGDVSQAVHFHLQTFRLREKMGDKNGVACSLNNLGNVYGRAEDFGNSVHYHEQCLAASRENGQPRLEAMCLSNLSIGYSSLGRYSEAVEAGKSALRLAQGQGSFDKQCYAVLSIGRAFDKEEKYAEAVAWYSEAIALARQSSSRRNECEAQNALGGALIAAGRISEAYGVLTQAEAAASALGLTQFRADALAGLSKACEQQGETAAALAHYKLLYSLEKTLSSDAADKRAKTLMIQMEVEKAQKEAQFHQLKNVELAALNAALQAQAELLEAQGEELRAQADELQRQAAEDGLTGLANRRQLENQLARHFSEARHTRCPLSVAMADVDHFKQINDRFGHQIGDEVLMSIGLLLRHACRSEDLAARYGGEEFVLVLPQTDLSGAAHLCERVRRIVEEHPWQTIHPSLSVTLSMGVSENQNAPSYERLLGLADAQLYEAKHAGRNRVFPAVPAGLTLQ